MPGAFFLKMAQSAEFYFGKKAFLASSFQNAIMNPVVAKRKDIRKENEKCLKSTSSSPQTAPP
jgi:hypothetical protein